MPHKNIYFDLVQNTHDMIESWFSGTDISDVAYEKLMADFSADFTLITMGGTKLSYAQVSAFFKAHSNAKPALKISLENLTLIYEGADGAVVSYLERQDQPDHQPSKRLSTAVLAKDKNGQLRWKYLHETAAS